MAEGEVLSPPGERFCAAVGPLGYLNLLAGRAGFVSPMLGAGEMGVVGAGKVKPRLAGKPLCQAFSKALGCGG